jgi:beta-lactamase regulating signal transducer with metallopeptidase domain
MNALDSLDGISRAWGGWMLAMAWQVAFLVLILSGLTWIWRRQSAVLLHTLWLLVLVRLVLPPTFAFPTGWAFWVLPASGDERALKANSVPADAAGAASLPGDRRGSRSGQSSFARDSLNSADVSEPGGSPPRAPTANETAPETLVADERRPPVPGASPVTPGTTESDRSTPPIPGRSWSSSLMLAWAGVSGTLLGFLFWGSLRVRRWVRDAEPIDDPELYSLLEDCRERLGITRLVELRNSESCTTPVVVGVRRPVILLPKAVLSDLTYAEMQAVLLHELNHIARGDALVNLLQGVLGAFYFFHPLVWWANAWLRRLREEACDELTVAALDGDRRIYGEAIVKVTEIFGYASPPLALGVLESKSPARARLGRILDPQLPQGAPLTWRTAFIGLVLAAILLPGAGGRMIAAQPRELASSSPDRQIAAPTAGDSQPASAADTPADGAASDEPSNADSPPTQAAPATTSRDAEVPDKKPASAPVPPLDGKGPLRYRWEANKTYAYTIQIEADEGESIETLTGTPAYTVRSTGTDGTAVVFNGRLMSMQKFKPRQGIPFGRPPRIRSPFSPFSGVGVPTFPTAEHVLHLDDNGNLQSMSGDSQLPFVLGNLSQLVLVPLPNDAQVKWEESEKTSVTLRTEDDRFPFPRPRFGPFANRDEGERLEARQRTEYQRDEPQGDSVVIRKKYELKTTQTHDGQPRLELAGETEITFDLTLGLPTALSGKLKLVNHTENTTHRTPITVTARLLSEEERARLEAEQKEAARRKPLDDAALDEALADLTAQEASRVQNAAGKLERAEPQGRQAEVARALEPLLESKDNFIRQAAARALAVWCDQESVPVLIGALDDEFFTVPWAALEALGKLKDERAIGPVASVLKAKKHRQQAIQSLAAMGPMAEDAALELLAESDSDMRYDACQILKEVGGKKSLRPLTKASRDDSNGIVRLVADQALKAVKGRNP